MRALREGQDDDVDSLSDAIDKNVVRGGVAGTRRPCLPRLADKAPEMRERNMLMVGGCSGIWQSGECSETRASRTREW